MCSCLQLIRAFAYRVIARCQRLCSSPRFTLYTFCARSSTLQNESVPRKSTHVRSTTPATSSKADELTLEIEGHAVKCTRLNKVLYPQGRFTKAALIDFYVRVAPFLLPHFKDRPVTLKRYPDGVTGEAFWEKDAPSFTPEWVERFPVPRRAGGPAINYIIIQNTATIAWAANSAALELHPFLHRVANLDNPTSIVFDLDPGEGADLRQCIQVAFLLRKILEQLGLKLFPKVSGSKGLQIYVPLNTRVTYEVSQPFAHSIAQWIEREHPKLAVSEMPKEKRVGKVFIDWSQNAAYKTTVGVYSLRAKQDRPFVSMPVTWDELSETLKRKKVDHLYFEPQAALARLDEVGDLFADVLKLEQSVPEDLAGVIQEQNRRNGRAGKRLHQYGAKRDFSMTPEPTASVPRRSAQGSRRRFVVQKHAASHLHYDFRLEIHGVLKSWAVPKGIPVEPGSRRLASATEDHPLEYLRFEGVIPEGQYGGGTVMVWDIGTFEIVEGNYWKGNLHISLKGKKLKGEWMLTRDRGKRHNAWVLERMGDAMKPIPAKKEDQSALTGRSMNQIADAKDAVWQSNRARTVAMPEKAVRPNTAAPEDREIDRVEFEELPRAKAVFLEPMLALATDRLPDGPEWQYELKLDGYRALAIKSHRTLQLRSRRNNDFSARYLVIAQALRPLPDETVLDGEIVALDEQGRPSFNTLQNFGSLKLPVFFYVFDLPILKGRDLRAESLRVRRQALKSVLSNLEEPIRYSPALDASLPDLIRSVREQHLEGVIAKRRDSVYESGKRTGSWLKMRINKGQELVIGGYIPGPHRFDSLLVGYYESDRLLFMAKVRNGFTPSSREQVAERFRGLDTDQCPFDNLPEPKSARRGKALTAEAMRECCWLKPELVAQVEFTDWTDANHLRHSRFIALREDKTPREVVKEAHART